MRKVKARCSHCGKAILIYYDENLSDWDEESKLKVEELMGHICPSRDDNWSVFLDYE